MKKLRLVLREMLHLIWKEKLLFLLPILVALALLAFFVYQLGPAVIVSFIYAGL